MQINAAAAFQPRTDEVSNSRQFSRAEVCRVFNLPVGILEEATASNLAQQRIGLYSETLRPLLDRIADSVTAQTLSDFDLDPGTHTVAFDLAEATRPPMPELIAAVAQGVREGFVTPAEGRDMLGLAKLGPEAKADKLRLAANINILGDTAAPANAPGPAGLPGKPLNPARDNAERQDRAQSQNAGKRWAFCEEHGRHYTDAEWRLCHTSE